MGCCRNRPPTFRLVRSSDEIRAATAPGAGKARAAQGTAGRFSATRSWKPARLFCPLSDAPLLDAGLNESRPMAVRCG